MSDDGIACGYERTMYSHETKLRQMIKGRVAWKSFAAVSHDRLCGKYNGTRL